MLISPENPVATYNSTQLSNIENMAIRLSSDTVKGLGLSEGQIVPGTVSEDGKSITLSTETGPANILGSFERVAGEDVNVRVGSAEIRDDTEPEQTGQIQGQRPTRQSQLDKVFEGASQRIDKSLEVEKLLSDLKTAVENGESSVFGEVEFFEGLPSAAVNFQREGAGTPSSILQAPEARVTEQAEMGESAIDLQDGEVNSGEEDWQGFNQLVGSDEDWAVEVDAEIGNQDHVWIQGRVSNNHGRFNLWFDNPGTAAYARQNINEVAHKIEKFGILIDHLGISPFPRDKADDPPKSTFMVNV
jgi:hypothetical protein